MRDPIIIVPAAGDSKRYRDAGILMPKSLIRFRRLDTTEYRLTMLENCLQGLPVEWRRYAITKMSDVNLFEQQFSREINVIGIEPTRGQSESLYRGILSMLRDLPDNLDWPVLIINSDNAFRYPLETFVDQCELYGAGALVFPGYGDRAYSYINKFPIFNDAAEKQPISEWAMGGAYYFRSLRELHLVLARHVDNINGEEPYLSAVFKELPYKSLAVAMQRDQLISWGTPEDLVRDPLVVELDRGIQKILEELK